MFKKMKKFRSDFLDISEKETEEITSLETLKIELNHVNNTLIEQNNFSNKLTILILSGITVAIFAFFNKLLDLKDVPLKDSSFFIKIISLIFEILPIFASFIVFLFGIIFLMSMTLRNQIIKRKLLIIRKIEEFKN